MSENKPRCCQLVPSGFGRLRHFKRTECGKPAKVERDGKHYCGIHDPMRKAEHAAKRDARYAENREMELAEWAAERERDRRAECFDELLDALEWTLNALTSVLASKPLRDADERIAYTKSVIIKAKGEQS